MSKKPELVDITRDYYDSADADNFYFTIWGGEDIHVGIYDEGMSISEASQRTVRTMAEMVSDIQADTKVLDLGAGYGGAARFLAKTFGCQVVAQNLSEVENARNREMNQAQGLSDHIEVVGGNMEQLPFEDQSFDLVWSEDAILHVGDKEQVFAEVDRVLKPGGEFIFTDPMQADQVDDPSVLVPILKRIHLEEMGSFARYKRRAAELSWELVNSQEMPEQLVNHYSSVHEQLATHYQKLRDNHVSESYLENMKQGLQHWIAGGKAGHLNWGILHFRKPA
jgi:ubiquinone/menaquinone biosynthesis C-methylase UbiE